VAREADAGGVAAAAATQPDQRTVQFPPTDRRRTERRGMDKLRAEALNAVVTMVEDRNFGGLRDRVGVIPRSMPRSRLLLLAVALIAGGAAAWLATRHDAPPVVAAPEAPTITTPLMTQILVAKVPIAVGQKLTPDMLGWQEWPSATLQPQYIDIAATPDAAADMAGSVARTDFVAGEPIRPDKLATAEEGSLSALLDNGMRGVSVMVSPDAASGGFIVPGDRVDVVLTRPDPRGAQVSQTILSDVKVLAINANLGRDKTESSEATTTFSAQAIATLALDPRSAEIIINAASAGKLSLMLVPLVDAESSGTAAERAANAAIRLSSPFWVN
jgi:pilus assembly protein CpaB